MKTRQLAVCILILSLAAAGCSSSANGAATADVPPAAPAGSAEPAANPSDNRISATPTTPTPITPTAAPTAPPQPKDPPPTAEQIARWTPPPFEPLQLLAVREWKETSFTSRLVAAPDGSHYIVAGSRVLLWGLTADGPEHVFLDLTADDADRELKVAIRFARRQVVRRRRLRGHVANLEPRGPQGARLEAALPERHPAHRDLARCQRDRHDHLRQRGDYLDRRQARAEAEVRSHGERRRTYRIRRSESVSRRRRVHDDVEHQHRRQGVRPARGPL